MWYTCTCISGLDFPDPPTTHSAHNALWNYILTHVKEISLVIHPIILNGISGKTNLFISAILITKEKKNGWKYLAFVCVVFFLLKMGICKSVKASSHPPPFQFINTDWALSSVPYSKKVRLNWLTFFLFIYLCLQEELRFVLHQIVKGLHT